MGFGRSPGKFIVNEIESYYTQRTACDVSGFDKVYELASAMEDYWFKLYIKLVKYHFNNIVTHL